MYLQRAGGRGSEMTIPIIGQGVFVVCARGHVNEAPQHGTVMLATGDEVKTTVLCSVCQFEFFSAAFGGLLMPRSTTRKEAEWKAKELKDAAEHGNGVPAPEPSTAS